MVSTDREMEETISDIESNTGSEDSEANTSMESDGESQTTGKKRKADRTPTCTDEDVAGILSDGVVDIQKKKARKENSVQKPKATNSTQINKQNEQKNKKQTAQRSR